MIAPCCIGKDGSFIHWICWPACLTQISVVLPKANGLWLVLDAHKIFVSEELCYV